MLLICIALAGCGGGTSVQTPPVQPVAQPVQNIPVDPNHSDIVIIGDSLMARWWYEQRDLWPAGAYPAGIGGQTSVEIAARFKVDVLDRTPLVAVIEGGVNDLYFTGQLDQQRIYSLVTQAQAAGICVVLLDILPVDDPDMPSLVPFNEERRIAASSYGIQYVAAFETLAVNGKLNPLLSIGDGYHLNRDGYGILAPLVHAAISRCTGSG
jgi:lysophospholipase L1-like esterase